MLTQLIPTLILKIQIQVSQERKNYSMSQWLLNAGSPRIRLGESLLYCFVLFGPGRVATPSTPRFPIRRPGHENCRGLLFAVFCDATTQLALQLHHWVRNAHIHPKTLIEIAMVLSTDSGSFPSNSHVSATFSILLRCGEFWNPTNCEKFNADGSLMGRTNLDKSVW